MLTITDADRALANELGLLLEKRSETEERERHGDGIPE